jgi:hypothetical protein
MSRAVIKTRRVVDMADFDAAICGNDIEIAGHANGLRALPVYNGEEYWVVAEASGFYPSAVVFYAEKRPIGQIGPAAGLFV